MAQHGHLTREEKKHIRVERKKLRKDLRAQGITKRKEFEEIAQMLGLVYGDDYPRFLGLWWRFLDFLAKLGIKFWFGAAIAALALLFPFAVMANQKGNFIVNMTTELMQSDIMLSDNAAFSDPKVRLFSDVLKEVNAYSVADLPDNLNDQEGSHNMNDVLAYTFWVGNQGSETVGYDWYLVLNSTTKNVDKATWLMVYDEDGMVIYAQAKDDGTPETTGGYFKAPLASQAAHPDTQYRQESDGSWSVVTTPYAENKVAAKGTVEKLAPGEAHKYTVVIWVEGDDEDCSNDLIGGHAGYAFRLTARGDSSDVKKRYGYASTDRTIDPSNPISTPFHSISDKIREKFNTQR